MTLSETLDQIQTEVSFCDEKLLLTNENVFPFHALKTLIAEKAFLAGGAITSLFSNKPINDFDIFFRSEESFKRVNKFFRSMFVANSKDYSTTNNSVTYKNFAGKGTTVQLIRIPTSFKENPVDIFQEFDFVACCGLYDFASDRFLFHRDFLKHVSQRKLVYQSTHRFPISSLMRVEKYKAKGYTIDNVNFLKIVLHISSLGITTNKQAAEQFQGMYLGEKRIGFEALLKDESPLNLNTFIDIIEGRAIVHTGNPGLSGLQPDELPF